MTSSAPWLLVLRRKDAASRNTDEHKLKAELLQGIQDGRVDMRGLIRQEPLSGIKEKGQFDKVKAAVDPYLDRPVNTADHEYAARASTRMQKPGR